VYRGGTHQLGITRVDADKMDTSRALRVSRSGYRSVANDNSFFGGYCNNRCRGYGRQKYWISSSYC